MEDAVEVRFDQESNMLGELLLTLLPFVLIIAIWIFLMRSMGRTQSAFTFGKRMARRRTSIWERTALESEDSLRQW